MKTDVRQLLKRFTRKGIKVGDLVITGEIHRVLATTGFGRGHLVVANVEEDCAHCRKLKLEECCHERIVHIGTGQQGVMKLKSPTQPARDEKG